MRCCILSSVHRRTQLAIAVLFACVTLPSVAVPAQPNGSLLESASLAPLRALPRRSIPLEKKSTGGALDTNRDGSTFLWVIQDTYGGPTFFDGFDFFTYSDPTHGHVNYVTKSDAFQRRLSFVTDDNKVIMKGDNTSWLQPGQFRDSVRISSKAQYSTGLFILDLNKAPWGCAVWPAFWTVGSNWPYNGEIDIIEGVHDNEHNQVTWHTAPGCTLNSKSEFTGTVVANSQTNPSCDGTVPGNPGCGITEWSRASYGPYFDAQGGGVFAMKWDENGIAIWSFYRAAIPQDILKGEPTPSNWGTPSAALDPSTCDPIKYFVNHSIVFDVTFCGDWAGNSYATSGCPGTCAERLVDPRNFDNATWIINSLKVYKKQRFSISLHSGAGRQHGGQLAVVSIWVTSGMLLLGAIGLAGFL